MQSTSKGPVWSYKCCNATPVGRQQGQMMTAQCCKGPAHMQMQLCDAMMCCVSSRHGVKGIARNVEWLSHQSK